MKEDEATLDFRLADRYSLLHLPEESSSLFLSLRLYFIFLPVFPSLLFPTARELTMGKFDASLLTRDTKGYSMILPFFDNRTSFHPIFVDPIFTFKEKRR